MDADLVSKVSALLSDPETASKIAAIAASFAGGEKPPEPPVSSVPPPVSAPAASLLPSVQPKGDPRLALLYSIKPLLRDEKKQKIDSLARALTLVTLLGGLKKGGGQDV